MEGATQSAVNVEDLLIDILKVIKEENRSLRQEIYSLNSRISRYDQIFEKVFDEEVQKRLRSNKSLGDDSAKCGVDPLYLVEQKLYYMRESSAKFQEALKQTQSAKQQQSANQQNIPNWGSHSSNI